MTESTHGGRREGAGYVVVLPGKRGTERRTLCEDCRRIHEAHGTLADIAPVLIEDAHRCEECDAPVKSVRSVRSVTGIGLWGGARPGAGRKPKLEDARNVTVYLTALHVHWLERHGRSNRAATLRALIDADIAAHQRYHKEPRS
jgi:hypothetical protein